ncbi:lytic transglycosylase domain-containing protein [Microbacterium sp. No. 7]|uniref:aggregation-promoting factor C-terminal-like domain-containing protein n=1 Tax=Microbacterium sp. No. 7 TaxID=1714373 RepID=UPI0006ED24BD|nr:lytic transglycosylase domain-containing protein [Microbacterium sp. No. 7]ALJ20299.1 hypothetical protein AOA12_10400 [Microbacterium sp. No. 7]
MTSDLQQTSPTSRALAKRAQPPARRRSRGRGVKSTLALLAVAGLSVAYIGPMSGIIGTPEEAVAAPVTLYVATLKDAQSYQTGSRHTEVGDLGRGDITYTVELIPTPTPTPTPAPASSSSSSSSSDSSGSSDSGESSWAPPFVAPDPGSAQAIAYDMVLSRGWGDDEFSCLVALWNRESGWRVNAYNASSGAYGIPQSLPAEKMASAGADWETNPATQISWGLGYIGDRYGTPCGAWGHSESYGWY